MEVVLSEDNTTKHHPELPHSKNKPQHMKKPTRARVDSNLVEISGLKYFGKTEGDNNRRKAKAWLPREYLDKARDLKTGEFLHQYGSKITLEEVPLFQSRTKPRPYVEPEKPKKPNLITRMIRALVGA